MKTIGNIRTPYGAGVLASAQYGNGALALVINDGGQGRIATVSVNLDHGQPCTPSHKLPPGHFYLDINNLTGELVHALRESGHVLPTDMPEGVSGYCTYPVWRLT